MKLCPLKYIQLNYKALVYKIIAEIGQRPNLMYLISFISRDLRSIKFEDK